MMRQRVQVQVRVLLEQPKRGVLVKSRWSSTMATPAPPTALPAKHGVGPVVSRRVWQRLYQKPPRDKGSTSGNKGDEKPWPRSVQILGYTMATTVVPFCIAWYIATNVAIRRFLEPYVPGMVPLLRQWFGQPEEQAISYVDRLEQEFPLSLDDEPPTKVRREQAEIDALQDLVVPTRIRVFTHGGFNLSEIINLPGNMPASVHALLQVLMKDREQTIDPQSVSYVTVEFQNVSQHDQEKQTDTDSVIPVHLPSTSSSATTGTSSSTTTTISPLTHKTNVFSLWHYQPMLSSQQQQQQSSSSSNTKNKSQEIRISQLEYEIDELKRQLKDRTTMRDLDELSDELKRSKRELRRLQWKRRFQWFG